MVSDRVNELSDGAKTTLLYIGRLLEAKLNDIENFKTRERSPNEIKAAQSMQVKLKNLEDQVKVLTMDLDK